MLDSTPITKGEQRPFTSPTTPEPHQQNERYADGVYSATPANSSVADCTSPGSRNRDMASPVPCDLATHYKEVDMDESLEEEIDVVSLQHNLEAALLEKEASQAETESLREAMRKVQEEARDNMKLFHRCLESERELSACAVQQANDAACMLRDANIQLSAEVDLLRARIEELELEALPVTEQDTQLNEEGNEQLIAILQVEIADLERKLQRAHRGRSASAEGEAAAMQRADILAQQVEQMAVLMEAEREENVRLKVALQEAGLLPRTERPSS